MKYDAHMWRIKITTGLGIEWMWNTQGHSLTGTCYFQTNPKKNHWCKLLKRSVDPPTLQPNYRSITYDIPRLRFERKIQPKPSDQLTTIAKHVVALQCHRRGSTIHGCFTYPCMSSMANRFTLEQILRKRAQKTLEIRKLVLVCIC